MFTGLVEESGIIKKIQKSGGSVVFTIRGKKTPKGLKVDDSIAINGVCLTVIKKTGLSFEVQAVEETLYKTTLGDVGEGGHVNLERPLRANDRLGGHFVLGHVDTTIRIKRIEKRESSWMFWFVLPKKFRKFIIPVGSIAIDGVSLTIAAIAKNSFAISIIPHTMDVTIFREYAVGRRVNVEFDVLGKYAESFLQVYKERYGKKNSL